MLVSLRVLFHLLTPF
ncbi:hypothetical protein Zm00014a_009684 [Zea mays]|uniref:Uncharacterized protein n=1 Tax=Zea mays TaxID=4577 RepID=A0A3L6EIU9_MAIZE|nr:hypothetical protein Zm00014a_009684 [Zea mays]